MKPQAAHTYEDKLLEFVYGELPPAEARSVESHLKGCAKCSGALDQIQGVRRSMSALSTESAPDAGLESLLAYANQTARRIQAAPSPRRTRWNRWVLSLAGVASLAIVGVVATRVARVHTMESPQQMAEAVVVAKYEQEQAARREQEASLELPPPAADALEAEKLAQSAPAPVAEPRDLADPDLAKNYVEGARLPSTVSKEAPRKSRMVESKRKGADSADYAQGTRVDGSKKSVAKADELAAASESIEPVPAPEDSARTKRGIPLNTGMASQSRVESAPAEQPSAPMEEDDRSAVVGGVAQSDSGRGAAGAASMPSSRSAMPSAPSAAPPIPVKRPAGSAASRERQQLIEDLETTSDRSKKITLLSRLCELEIDMGYIQPSSCIRIERDFPGTGAAALARSRLNAQRPATMDAEQQQAQ